jgi:hypothetical protein
MIHFCVSTTMSLSLAAHRYISRPLLIKGRKFDIRVHWLVAWTKPLLVFYNHHASVVRLSLNLYREFDFDRATHLTNLVSDDTHERSSENVILVSPGESSSLCLLAGRHRNDHAAIEVTDIHICRSISASLPFV